MSAEKKIVEMTNANINDTGNRGLHYEENLLWEKEHSDKPGVDFPAPENLPLRTGLKPRGNIGLPQVSEPQALRHFVRMSTWNYSIDHGFFPLGSCTMKHNPRLNEKLARLPGFAYIHPEQPASTVQGALKLMHKLQHWLAELTGLPGVCLSPAAGAHGELAGLMTIKRAHELKGNEHKTVLLVPDSAHGTNPATAVMCGFSVRSIPTKETGRLTLQAFRDALYAESEDGAEVAGMMVTNPNTCGLFENGYRGYFQICSTKPAAISIVTAPISTRLSAKYGPVILVLMSCTSICTKPFQPHMAAVVPAPAPSAARKS